MLVVKVELWPWGNEAKKREIARTYIFNTGQGTPERGDYKVRVCRNKYKDDSPYKSPSKEMLLDGKGSIRTGEVHDYPRKNSNVWQLVIRSLLSAFPEENKKNNSEKNLKDTINTISELIQAVVSRPQMYMRDIESAESFVKYLLEIRSKAKGTTVNQKEAIKYIADKYPDVPGSIRSITSGSEKAGLDWTEEMRKYLNWYNSEEKKL